METYFAFAEILKAERRKQLQKTRASHVRDSSHDPDTQEERAPAREEKSERASDRVATDRR